MGKTSTIILFHQFNTLFKIFRIILLGRTVQLPNHTILFPNIIRFSCLVYYNFIKISFNIFKIHFTKKPLVFQGFLTLKQAISI